jgi:hypothetical protein
MVATTLVFGVDGSLRDGEKEIASVREADGPEFARVSVGNGKGEIVRRRRHGWRYQLVDARGERVICDFRPLLLRRGGTLSTPGQAMELRVHLLRSRGWSMSLAGQPDIRAIARPGRIGDDGVKGWRRITVSGIPRELVLTAEEMISLHEETRWMLAFGCWLVLQWEGTAMSGAAGTIFLGS